MARPPARPLRTKMCPRFLAALRLHLEKQFANEVDEGPNAWNTPLVWPVENINRRRVPHLQSRSKESLINKLFNYW